MNQFPSPPTVGLAPAREFDFYRFRRSMGRIGSREEAYASVPEIGWTRGYRNSFILRQRSLGGERNVMVLRVDYRGVFLESLVFRTAAGLGIYLRSWSVLSEGELTRFLDVVERLLSCWKAPVRRTKEAKRAERAEILAASGRRLPRPDPRDTVLPLP